MSFVEEKCESIKRYILEKIRMDDVQYAQKTAENFQVSLTTIKRYVKSCVEKNIIEESNECACKYRLSTEIRDFEYELNGFLMEDGVFTEDIRSEIKNISKEAEQIWSYVFMEMMNNAIEHSEGTKICCRVMKDYLYTEISITDNGIGIFKKLQNYLKEKMYPNVTYQDVITELYKGKLTTNPTCHSGEGVFFSSKMLNEFAIWSDNTIFSFGCFEKEKIVQSHLISYYTRLMNIGTMVVMKLENYTTRKMKEVFDIYAPIEEGFVKTVIPMKEVCPYGEPIARSQARRILFRLELFKKVILDFLGVEFMGQGFADEVFRVFRNKHPEIEIIPVHANESVMGMIVHVQNRVLE